MANSAPTFPQPGTGTSLHEKCNLNKGTTALFDQARQSLDATPSRRPVPWLRRPGRPVLADGLQLPAASDALPRDAGMDGPMVLAPRRPVVPGVGVSRAPRGADGPSGVRPAPLTVKVEHPLFCLRSRRVALHVGPGFLRVPSIQPGPVGRRPPGFSSYAHPGACSRADYSGPLVRTLWLALVRSALSGRGATWHRRIATKNA